MTVLIIGGSGFLGGELTRQAIAAGHTVTATFGTRTGTLLGAEWRRLDLRRPEAITSLFEEVRPTVVINTAYRRSDRATTADGAISRYELGTLIARRDGLDPCALTTGKRAEMGPPGPLDVRLESGRTQSRISTVLRGAREFLAAPDSKKDGPGR
ncbi:sugar nucleotide-binding protein [Nocardiopsis alba]|jgi:dTDP-4-dehydrorhamnose reductase|uniref:sugar nucleotide-binding protein n=1 Tax=Nocardiopsis alba TaxID=53437 RepID=UPI0033B3950F